MARAGPLRLTWRGHADIAQWLVGDFAAMLDLARKCCGLIQRRERGESCARGFLRRLRLLTERGLVHMTTRLSAADLRGWAKFITPEDDEIPEPQRRKKGLSPEWKLQCACVKALRARMKYDKTLRFLAPMAEAKRTPQRAAIAKAMGLEAGVPDVWLMRNDPMRLCVIELKKPGEDLRANQEEWFTWLRAGGVRCERVDNVADFVKVLEGFV